MAHLPWHKETTTKPNRPKGMPAFLSYTPPKPKSEPKSKFNIVQDKREQNLSRIKTTKPKAPPGQPTSGIHTGYVKKNEEVKMPPSNWMDDLIKDQDGPQINEKGQITPSWATTTDDKKTSWLDTPGDFHHDTTIKAPFLRTGSVALTAKYYWDKNWPTTVERVEQTRKEWILPTDSWFVKKMKDTVITTLGGITQTGGTAMETGWSLTAQNVGALTAMSASLVNDIARSVFSMPGYTDKQKADLMDSWYEPINYGLLEAVPYRGFTGGWLRTTLPSNKAILNYSTAKAKYEFKNTINHFKKVKQKEKKTAPLQLQDNILTDKDIFNLNLKDITDAVIKEPIVKKEIKQLAIRTFEEIQTPKIGSYQANVIANHIRQTNDIVPVQAGVGAAVTPKELIPLKEPFFNPIKEVVDSLPVNEFDQIQVKDLVSVMSTKKYQRPMVLTKFNDFVANLKENNIQNVDKKTIDTYINNNPLEFTINVAQRDAPLHLLQKEKDITNEFAGAVDELKIVPAELANYVSMRPSYTISKDMPYVDAAQKSNIDYDLTLHYLNTSPAFNRDRGRLTSQALLTNENLFKDITENYITFVTESKSYTNTEAELFNEFYLGKIPLENYISKRGQVSHPTLDSISYKREDVLQAYKDKIMYNIGFVDKSSPYKAYNSDITPIKNLPVDGKIWTEKLLNNFNNRKHFDKDDSRAYSITPESDIYSDTYLGYTADAPKFKTIFSLEEFIRGGTPNAQMLQYISKWANPEKIPSFIAQLDGQPFSVNGLIELAKASKIDTPIQNVSPNQYVPTIPEQVYSKILDHNLNQIINKMDLRDIPEWELYISEIRNDKWNSNLQYLSSLETSKAAVGKEIQKAKLENKSDKIIKPFYKYHELKTSRSSGIEDISYEDRGGLTYTEHPYDKYMEIKLTSNNLSGYPEFGDMHFPESKNLVGWTINTTMRINTSPVNPKGNSLLVVHEMQSTDPMTEMGSKDAREISTDFAERKNLDETPVLGTAWYGELTQRSTQRFFDLSNVIKPTDFNPIPLTKIGSTTIASSIDSQLLDEWKMINPTPLSSIDYFIKVPNVWQGKRSFELGYSIIPSSYIMDKNKPLYIVADKEKNLMGHYQNINLTGKNEIITNVENATERTPPHKIIYDSYPSINAYLGNEFETYLKKEFEFDKQREMGYGADWYRKMLWGQLRYAYDNGFNFMAFPTTKTINKKWANRAGENYDNMMNVVNKWGFKVLSEKDASGRYIGTDMVDWGFHAPESVIRGSKELDTESEALPFGQLEREYLNQHYGDDLIHIIDLRDRNKIWEIMNRQEPVASLDKDLYQQTSELLSTFA
tara:strand:- start:249 stop:4232 length:3984 start_codon:yes stop_codon:yes gene_type:complete